MKFQNTITVNVPLSRFVELIEDPENMQYWQRDLVSYQLLDGDPGAVGSTMQMNYQMGKRSITMIETITNNNLPHEFSATYAAKGVWNSVENTFEAVDTDRTLWVSDNVFKFTGLMKVMSWFMPTSMFKKQSCQYLEDFKTFAEQNFPEQSDC